MKHLDARRSFFSEIVRHCVFWCGIFLFFLPISLHASKEGLDVKPGTQVVVPEGYAKIEAGDIELHFPPGGRQRAGELLDRATEAMGRLVAMIGYRPEMKTRIYLAGSTKDWRLLQPGRQKVPNWAAGITFPYIGVVVLRQAAERGGAIDLDTTLVHELSHIVFRQATKGKPVPKWFVEGIAIYHSEDFSLERAKLLVTAAATGRLYTLAELSHGFRVTRHFTSLCPKLRIRQFSGGRIRSPKYEPLRQKTRGRNGIRYGFDGDVRKIPRRVGKGVDFHNQASMELDSAAVFQLHPLVRHLDSFPHGLRQTSARKKHEKCKNGRKWNANGTAICFQKRRWIATNPSKTPRRSFRAYLLQIETTTAVRPSTDFGEVSCSSYESFF